MASENIRQRRNRAETIFITGTDTGVGKTLLTALLLLHLREEGRVALAMKPFCSGGREDAELLLSLQHPDLTLDEINPFHFREPLAPGVILEKQKRDIPLRTVLEKIRAIQGRCQTLLIEGAGGVMVPLGRNYLLSELAGALQCKTIIVGHNRLGTINHILLTAWALKSLGIRKISVVLMSREERDSSTRSNVKILRLWLAKTPILGVSFLGRQMRETGALKKSAKNLKKALALL